MSHFFLLVNQRQLLSTVLPNLVDECPNKFIQQPFIFVNLFVELG